MNKPDNTLKILVTVSSILFLLIAIKTSYPADDVWDMTLNIAGKFVIYELILFLTIYIAGPMLSDAIPGLWEYSVKAKHKLMAVNHKELTTQLVQHPDENNQSAQPISNESSTLEYFEDDDINRYGSELTTTKSKKITVLNEDIINYVTKTFENIISNELIEKLLNNFRNLNNGGPYDVIEKKVLPEGITQYDLWNFTWNITARIYDKKVSLEKMRDAGATLLKCSFPLTVTNDHQTVSRRMRYFDDRSKYSLPIIELGTELVPHKFPMISEERVHEGLEEVILEQN